MVDTILVDTNVFLRHLLGDIPDHAARSSALFNRAQAGEVILFAPTTVFVELTFVLHRNLKRPRKQIVAALLDLLSMRALRTDHPGALIAALEFWDRQSPLSFPDCFHLALASTMGLGEVCTFDRKMDRYPGVTRIEP